MHLERYDLRQGQRHIQLVTLLYCCQHLLTPAGQQLAHQQARKPWAHVRCEAAQQLQLQQLLQQRGAVEGQQVMQHALRQDAHAPAQLLPLLLLRGGGLLKTQLRHDIA
jgi:hypothetical protein